jgi:pilus assembly protein CpaF
MSSPAANTPPPGPGSGDGRPRMPWERTGELPVQVRRDGAPGLGAPPGPNRQFFQDLKSRVHRRLIERLNLSSLDKLSREQVVDAIRKVVYDLLAQESAPLNFEEREELVRQVLAEIFGLGAIEPLMQDTEISDVLFNTYKKVYI